MFSSRQFMVALFGFAAGVIIASYAGFREFLPGLLAGALVTIEITVLAACVAVVCAVIAALAKLYGPLPIRWLAVAYIETFRGTSALVQLFWLFFVLPFFGVSLEPITVAVIGLGLNVGAYGAEVVRGAIQSVARGQWEATVALNMSRTAALRGNLLIELLKATSLVSLITISDLAFIANTMNQTTLRTVEIFSIVLVIYLGIALIITHGVRTLERRAARGMARGRA